MWIELIEKNKFDSGKLSGLRIIFDKKIDVKRKEEVKKFAKWLRRHYYFPIRCDIQVCCCSYFEKADDDDVESVVDFYYKDGFLPCIKVASYPNKKSQDKNYYIQIQARIAYALTFYYQWFFYEFDKRSDRSLKMEATKWQNFIMDKYTSENNL